MKFGKKLILTSTFIGSTLIFTALAAYRPGDSAHVVSETNPEGGKARHGAHFSYGMSRCSVLVTSKVKLDRKENLKISVKGANPPPFEIIGRNPSVFDLGIYDWPRIEGDTIYGVQKDKIAFYVVFRPPEKDPVCGMWVGPDSEEMKEFKGKSYQFCSMDCKNAFAGDPAKFAEKPMPSEKCSIVLTDSHRRKVLTVPVDFSEPGAAVSGRPSSAKTEATNCPDCSEASESGHKEGGKGYHREGMKK